MKKALAAALVITALFLSCAAAEESFTETFVYGKSALGRDLECVRVGSPDAEKRLLLVFCVHGYEDVFIRDGALLTEIAGALIDMLSSDPAALQNSAVYIVPCANPDGLLEGTSNAGFGRCNAEGLDINRDFPEGWVRRSSGASRTGDAPFSTPEARALRDLVLTLSPDYAADVHGYVNAVKYSSRADMAKYFASKDVMNMKSEKWRTGGMLCAWLDTVTNGALLIELPTPIKGGNVNVLKEGYAADMAARLFRGVTGWLGETGN